MKTKVFLLLTISVFLIGAAYSQNSGNDYYISGLVGYGRSFQDHKLRDMPVFGLQGDIYNGGWFTIRGSAEFFSANYKYPAAFFEYQGTYYTGYFNQQWDNLSIGADFISRVTDYSSLGIGLSMEGIFFKKEYPVEIFPFRVNYYNNDEVLYFSKKKDANFVKLAISGIAIYEPNINWFIKPFLQARWKIAFVGKDYSNHAAGIKDMLSISLGLKYGF